jgi:hypothetical protein
MQKHAVGSIFLFLMLSTFAFSQGSTQVSGVVTDPSGALLPWRHDYRHEYGNKCHQHDDYQRIGLIQLPKSSARASLQSKRLVAGVSDEVDYKSDPGSRHKQQAGFPTLTGNDRHNSRGTSGRKRRDHICWRIRRRRPSCSACA